MYPGAITSLSWQVLKKNSATKVVKLSSVKAQLRTINLGIFHPLTNNMSLESVHFQFAVCFMAIATMGLLAAQELGLIRGYWVLITICVLLRPATFLFCKQNSIANYWYDRLALKLALLILANVHDLWFLYCILFVFASVFYAVRNVNYALMDILLNSICPYTFQYSNPWSNISFTNKNIRYHDWCRPLLTRSIDYSVVLIFEEISITLKLMSSLDHIFATNRPFL